jgi:hypothetical protein
MGIVRRQNNYVMPRCNLYREYFCRVLGWKVGCALHWYQQKTETQLLELIPKLIAKVLAMTTNDTKSRESYPCIIRRWKPLLNIQSASGRLGNKGGI